MDRQQVAFQVHHLNSQVLDRDTLITHMTGHALSLPHLGSMGCPTDRARSTMSIGLTVRLRTASEPVALDATCEATALRHTYDVHMIANLEDIDADGLSHLNLIVFSKCYLSQVSQRGQVVAT
jgi:hypothetical protein